MVARHRAKDTLHSIPRQLQLSKYLSFQLTGFIRVIKQYTAFALSKRIDLYSILVELRTY